MASLCLRPIHLQPLPYSFQKTLPDLGRGGPWVSNLLLESRAAQCAAPTTFLQHPKAARPGGRALQPSTSYHLLNRARRRYEIAVAIIFANPGPSGPEETAESHSDFARRKFSTDLQVRVPRNGGPGVSRHWRTKFASAASPGDPQGELPRRGKRRWPGPLGTFPSCRFTMQVQQ